MYPSNYGTHSVEFFSGKNWEGLLLFPREKKLDKCRWQLDWHCMHCSNGGFIFFGAVGESTELDLDAVRRVVQSVDINCVCLPDDVSFR